MTEAALSARFGERLVAAGLASRAQVDAALRAQRLVRGRLGHQLVRLGEVPAAALSEFLEKEIAAGRLPGARARDDGEGDPLAAVPARLAHLYNVYPVAFSGGRLDLGVPPLHGQHVIEAVADATGCVVEPLVLPAEALRKAIERDYLGSPQDAVLQPPAGVATLVVEDELRELRPVAPDLRTGDISAETFLRSVIAETVRRRARVVDLAVSPQAARLLIGGEPVPLPPPAEIPPDLDATLARLARPRAFVPSATPTGRFRVQLRGRRLPVAARRADGDPPAWRLHLGEDRLAVEDLDVLFAGNPEAEAGVEDLVASGRGLLLVAGPAGGGARRLVALLGERLAEAVPGSVRVRDVAGHASGPFAAGTCATGDVEAAQAIQHAAEQGAPLVVADEIPGPRTLERALLAAARRPVVAGFPVTDDAAALAWMGRQGLLGAVKTGLLRGVLSVLASPSACACLGEAAVPRDLLRRFGFDDPVAGVRANAGCDACLGAASRRCEILLSWRAVSAEDAASAVAADEASARRAARAAGRPPLLDAVLLRSARGAADAGEVLHLVASEIA